MVGRLILIQSMLVRIQHLDPNANALSYNGSTADSDSVCCGSNP